MPFIAPILICLNEKDKISLLEGEDIAASAIYFNPKVINDSLTYENIRRIYQNLAESEELSHTTRQDLVIMELFIENDGDYKGHYNIGPATAVKLHQLFKAVEKEHTEQYHAFWPCRGRSFFIELLWLVKQLSVAKPIIDEFALDEGSEDVHPVILYLHNNYKNKLTLPDLSKTFHTNRNSLRERFLKATGMPVIAYLIMLRIRIASLLLQDTSLPINEVMERVGIDDLTHFSRMFKKYAGTTPSKYREMNRK
jgi:AraC family L-rhamnose operon regulatory protein RhaS